MIFLLIPFFLLLFFVQPSTASILNCSFTGTGGVYNNTLEQYGIFDGETVSYSGNYFIDTDLIAIDHIYYANGLVNNIMASGDFVISGATTVNDIILPVMPESNAILSFSQNMSSSTSYETFLSFDVLSPLTGEVYGQSVWTINLLADFNTENYFDQDDIFLQPLLSWESGVPYLVNDGNDLVVGGNGSQLSIVIVGDVNDDGQVDLADAILCLKVVSGFVPNNIHPGADVDGDGKVGLGEAIYGIQKVAGY